MKKTITLFGEVGYGSNRVEDFREHLKGLKSGDELVILIDSDGGDVYKGGSIYNLLKLSPATITGVIIGACSSMATVLLNACNKRKMAKTVTKFIIHAPSGGGVFNRKDLKKIDAVLAKLEDDMIASYELATGKSKEYLRETYFDGEDHDLTPEEALAEGFIDEIIDYKGEVPQITMFNQDKFRAFITKNQTNIEPKTTVKMTDAEKQEFEALKADNARLKAENEKKDAAMKAAKVKALIDAHVQRGAIKATQAEAYTIAANADFDTIKSSLEAIEVKVEETPSTSPVTAVQQGGSVNQFLASAGNPFDGSVSVNTGQAKKYEAYSDSELEKIQKENPEQFKAVVQDFYFRTTGEESPEIS